MTFWSQLYQQKKAPIPRKEGRGDPQRMFRKPLGLMSCVACVNFLELRDRELPLDAEHPVSSPPV